ncbi:adenylate/guanylate cyclase domain-containing protein [Ruegeria marina]|uniref:Adenylate and Guanylate cyclase catalytic domain-containing protein n=1 Tax=Ruegeria marina TaxID=639004 RepID=A0A1G7CJX7_9RHOB|nr:adenylate/guanylate cyclase domain-containing protein [Ruegeria marina]SDE39619.1 Adenylate and Guanylate cyclase catalytic domain-containing protein [Ruegeria marina]
MKRRLLAILMADVVGYSRRMETDRTRTIDVIRDLRERWLEPECASRGGEVLKRMGDGWIIGFPSLTDAVEAAQAVQSALNVGKDVQLRIAVHLGEVVDDGTDIYGTSLNIAARLQTEAPPGGVMISGDLHRQIDGPLASDFTEAGSFELKNIRHPVQGYQWRPFARDGQVADELPLIAVEPFVMGPGCADNADAADDLRSQMLTRLSRRTGVRVAVADSALAGSPTYLLRGRFRADADRTRLSLSLVLAASGAVLWSEDYSDTQANLFALIDKAAARADGALRVEINAHDADRIDELPDEALSAAELRARAAKFFYTAEISGYERAATLLERALRLAPGNGMALAMWGHAMTKLIECGKLDADPALIARVAQNVDAAVQAAPRSDFVFKAQADLRAGLLGDLPGARRSIERAESLNADYTLLAEVHAQIALAEGDYDAACDALTPLLEASGNDPFRHRWFFLRAFAEWLADRPEKALAAIQEATDLRPGSRALWLLLAEAQAALGQSPDAALGRAAALPAGPDIAVPFWTVAGPGADKAARFLRGLKAAETL